MNKLRDLNAQILEKLEEADFNNETDAIEDELKPYNTLNSERSVRKDSF